MRQLTLTGTQQLEWWDVPAPRLENDKQALVRPDCVARCDLDVYMYLGVYTRKPPYAFGHEMVGTVIDVGSAVKTVQPGQRVVVPFQISCGDCRACVRGWSNACTSVAPMAGYGLGTHPDRDWGGALSDLVRVPFADAMLMTLPEGVSAEAACGAGDNIADGFRTVAPLLARFPKESVLVVGGLAQSVGLYAVLAAVALGSSRVVYVDSDPARLLQAAALGAEVHNIDFTRQEADADRYLITVDAAATPEGLAFALRSTAACGFCTSVSGGLGSNASLPLGSMYLKGVTHEVSRVHSRDVMPTVLEHICCGKLDPLAISAHILNFEAAPTAMGNGDIKLIFKREA
ncbi:MAG: zinc-binding dehydrogenase [Congregibacter sp.]